MNDSKSIATCLLFAMEEIVYKFIGKIDFQKAEEFMNYFATKESNQYSYQNCWIAEEDGKVIAAVNVYDGAELKQLRQPIIDYIKSNFKRELEIEDETRAGEYYIDSLGVRPEHQGKGIGSKLLQSLIDEHVIKNGRTLALLVDEENADARRLYVRLGFQSAGKQILLGKTMEHLQIKS